MSSSSSPRTVCGKPCTSGTMTSSRSPSRSRDAGVGRALGRPGPPTGARAFGRGATVRPPVGRGRGDRPRAGSRLRADPAHPRMLLGRRQRLLDVRVLQGHARALRHEGRAREQLARALARYRDEPYVKVYTSGSFLDDREVDPASRTAIVSAFSGRARRFLFETLPEFVRPEEMSPLKAAFAGELEVALGLESTDPTVLGRFVNKGSSPAEYLAAADRLASLGVRRKAYLLLKPPYLTESEAVADVVRSVREAAAHFDSISVNPVHIQNGTVVEWLYHRGRYRPPWLWSLVDVLKEGAAFRGTSRLVSFPTAGGLARGPHNCGSCDARVLAAIQEASLSQEFAPLDELDCPCRTEWRSSLAYLPLGVEA